MSIPEIIQLHEKFGRKGLVIFGISMDDPRMVTDEQLRVFKEKAGINYSVLRVNRQILQDYFGDEQISIPTMFVIDRDGMIRDKLVGFRPGALEKSVNEIL
jgi:peroxiredoxin